MPCFTAPKLLLGGRHEPEIFAAAAHVPLPKDYLRLRMTSRYASDLSDSAGTLRLDVGNRRRSDSMLAAEGKADGDVCLSPASAVLSSPIPQVWKGRESG
jgi:xylulokinase